MRLIPLLLALLLAGCAHNRDAQFTALADRYFDEVYFRYNPSTATSAGVHQHDARLEDLSPGALEQQGNALRAFEREVDQFGAVQLSPAVADDREMLLANIRGTLLSLDTLRPWETQPDLYPSAATNAIFVLMSRTFAPPAERLAAVIARERQIPRLFQQARANLRNPPRISTGIALEQLPGIESFFRKDVPAAFPGALTDEFRQTNAAVLDALKAYREFLRLDLLARSNGDFRIGAENYRRKLLYDEMVETPLDKLLETGYADLRRNQEEYRRVARKLDATRSVDAVRADLERDHPAPEALLQSFRDTLGGLRAFVQQRGIVTIPSTVPPILRETPPFMRALTFASMDTPGPYETVAKEAFFNVTLPEAAWPKQRIEEHMAAFNRGTVLATAIHEAYPGHYTQFLWVQRAPSKVRKLLGAGTNAEGWAHYTEQMMLDEGFAHGDLKMRLGQLQDALLRDARYIVGLQMHTGAMSYEEGIEFFVKEGFQPRANAERETKRGTSDPTYLVYTLGKLQILQLREDYRKLKGAQFSLKEFHDALLSQGFPPIPMVRRALLGAGR